MKTLIAQLRKFAEVLRKEGTPQIKPQPIPNPTASRASGDLGSLSATGPEKSKNKFVPRLPKLTVGGN